MRHLKLYEEAGKIDFEPIAPQNWPNFIKKIVSFDTAKIIALPSELKKEIKKTVQVSNVTQRRKITDSPNIPSDNLLNYLIIYIEKKMAGKPDMIFVYELEDEYYGVYADIGRVYFRFKCDQIEGVAKCINHIISS